MRAGDHIVQPIAIAASPELVWTVLTDFESYPSWNPFLRAIRGEAAQGARIRVKYRPAEHRRTVNFSANVISASPGFELRWFAYFLVPGLFDGDHTLRLDRRPDGTCLFTQELTFGGVLLPLLPRSLAANATKGFVAMNRALKARVEAMRR
jgi:hypothetical protein